MTALDAPPVGAVAVRDRALAPDVARGAMLLLIALANAHVWLFDRPVGMRGYPRDLTGFDRVIAATQLVFVDGRAYPLFALLFGYGVTQLATRRIAAGDSPAAAVRIVRRRGWCMLLIGLLHGVLLWAGDIVGAYGLLAVLLAGVLVRGAAGTLAGLAVGGTVFATVVFGAAALPRPTGTAVLPSIADPNPLSATVLRAVEWVGLGMAASVFGVFGAVALGAWAARSRLLDDPGRHRPLLRRLALAGLGTAVAGGLPLALAVAGVWTPSLPALLLCGVLHAASGYAGGVGYAALFGLLVIRRGAAVVPGSVTAARGADGPVAAHQPDDDSGVSRPGRPVLPVIRRGAAAPHGVRGGRVVAGSVTALAACGQRSLSCYLGQSVLFGALLPAWTLGLGARLTVAQAALLAVGVWLVLLLVAVVAALAGSRGPAETLLRRLTYGRPGPGEALVLPAVGDADQALLDRRRDQQTVAREEPPGREPA